MRPPLELIHISAVLREYRSLRGLSQEEVAMRAGLHRTYVGLLERGRNNPTLGAIDQILTVLEVSWEEFGRALDDRRMKTTDP